LLLGNHSSTVHRVSDLWADLVAVPAAIDATLDEAIGFDAASILLGDPGVDRVFICGNGASYYVALALWLSSLTAPARPTVVALPAGMLEASLPTLGSADRLLLVSSSGELRDAVEAVDRYPTVPFTVITAYPDSSLGRSATALVVTRIISQRAFTHTQAYCTALVAGLSIMSDVWHDRILKESLGRLPLILSSAVAEAVDWAARLDLPATPRSATVFGSGPGWAAAMETALLLKELAGIAAEGYETREGATTGMYALGPGDLAVSVSAGPDQLVAESESVLRSTGSDVIALPGGHLAEARLSPLTTFPFAVALAARFAERDGLDVSNPRWRDAYLATARVVEAG
jgi:fructoselysine-6-P-deglycase FrlB-like protein